MWPNAKVSVMGSAQLSSVMSQVSKYVPFDFFPSPTNDQVTHLISHRDPSQHSTLQEKIEHQSTALYATARLWDDGIIKPTETRDVLGLALALRGGVKGKEHDGDGGFGVFRM